MDTAQSHFPSSSYPMLDGLVDAQPYPTHERDYNSMSEFEQHQVINDHLQQDLTSYPDDVDGMDGNDFKAHLQPEDLVAEPGLEPQLNTEDKSDSENGASPGRSKPVPKPIRETTKDTNGRFYCNWPGCTEDVKDFGRRCEWRKVSILLRLTLELTF